MKVKEKIGLLGGSFDPPHAGHLSASKVCLQTLNLNVVWWIITERNPFKEKTFFSYFERYKIVIEMLKKEPKIKLPYSGDDISIFNTTKTVILIKFLQDTYINKQFFWIMGMDSFISMHKWYKWEEMFSLVPILIVNRVGYEELFFNCMARKKFLSIEVSEKKNKALYLDFLSGRLKRGWFLVDNEENSNLSSSGIRSFKN